MRWRTYVFWTGRAIFLLASFCFSLRSGTLAQSPPAAGQPAQEQPPWQRMLTRDDAKRVSELEQKADELWKAGKDAEAQAAAQEVLAIHRRVQGAGHWQTQDAQRQLRALEQIATLAADARAELARVAEQMAESERLYSQGQYAAAEPLDRQALAVRHRVLGEHHPDTAESYDSLAVALNAQGKYGEAEPLARQALAIWRRVLGEHHPDTARGYSGVAVALHAQGKYGEAEPLACQALAIWRRVLGEHHPDTARGYSGVAAILADQGKYAEAEPLYRQALEVRRRVLGEHHRDTAGSYNSLAHNLNARGQYAEAEPLARQALAIYRQVLGEQHPNMAAGYNNLAVALHAQGKYGEAEPLARQALAIWRRVLGEHHPNTARGYSGVATLLTAQGKYAEAEPLYRQALEIWRRRLGEHHPDVAGGYREVAANLKARGQYAAAELLYRQALEIDRRRLGEHHPNTAKSYNDLAAALHAQSRYAAAELLLRQALTVRRQVLGEQHHYTAQSYNNLAVTLKARGQYAAAEPLYRQALEIDRQVLGEHHPLTALGYNNLAATLDARGQYGEAELLYRQALEIRRRMLGEHHPDTAQSYGTLANYLAAQGQYAKAEEMLAKAVFGFESARLLTSHAGLERSLAGAAQRSPLPPLAALLARRGQPADAWRRLEADFARGLLDDLSARQFRLVTPEEAKREQELLGKLHRLEEQMAALLTKSAPLEAGTNRSLAGLGGVAPWAGQPGVAAAGAVLRSTYSLGWSSWQPLREKLAVLQDQHLTSQAEFSDFEQALVRKYGVAAGQTFEPDRLQAQLPAIAALVAWVDLPAPPQAADPNGEHWACVVRQRGEPVWVRLPGTGPDRAWTEADDQLPQQVWEGLVKPPAEGAPPWHDGAARLYAQRLAPLAESLDATPELPAVRHLVILPSRALAGVPVEALLAARPEGQPRYSISYAPSGTMFAWLQEHRSPADAPDGPARPDRLLALGDPVFTRPEPLAAPSPEPPDHGVLLTVVTPGANAAQSGIQAGDVLLRYAGTKLSGPAELRPAIAKAGGRKPSAAQRGEGGLVVTVWRDGKTLDLTVRPGTLGVLTSQKPAAEAVRESREADALLARTRGKAFTPLPGTRREVEAIARLFPQPEVLLGSKANEQELEQLAAADRLRAFRYLHFATHGVLDDQVALRSALILSQDRLADPRTQVLAGQEVYNGRVTAEQIRRTWKLDAELVTLSACQTGLGQFRGGEGYVGFAQALFLAGARSLVVSLWKVDDDATALLMTRFYQNLLGQRPGLQQPLPKAAALEEAKTWLRQLTAAEAARRRPRGEVEQVDAILSGPTDSRPYEHPYYWAAFILIGDPGDLATEPENQRSSLSGAIAWVIGGGVLVGALLLAVAARVRRRKLV
jgi:CHAT domain-containing protein/tetratricopeptide (TPR) repeat protein